MGLAFLASSTSALGASSVCGSDIWMTFAALVTETVGSPDVAVADDVCSERSLGSSPGDADPLDGVAAALLVGGRSAVATFGATSAADGGTDPTDAVAEALAVAACGDDGDWGARLGDAAVDATVGVSEVGATARGARSATFVSDGDAVAVGDAGATAVTTGAVVVCVTGGDAGATGSNACCVCCVCGGDSTAGAAGRTAGAFGGACGTGASVSSSTGAFGSGAAAVVVTT
jgi:hypothetical protein